MKRGMKLNRGFLLTMLVLLCVIVFLIVSSALESGDRTELNLLAKDYVARETGYQTLPEEYRIETPDIPADKLDKYIREMKDTLSAYYVDNEQCYKYLFENMENQLRLQASGTGVQTRCEKEIINTKIIFNGDTATMTLETRNDVEILGQNSPGVYVSQDTLTFQKEKGEWKLTYSSLMFQNSGIYSEEYFGLGGIDK